MKIRFLLYVRSTALVTFLAVSQTHVVEPAANLDDTTFLDGVAGPGGVIEEIAAGAHDGSVDRMKGLTHVALIGRKNVLGARCAQT